MYYTWKCSLYFCVEWNILLKKLGLLYFLFVFVFHKYLIVPTFLMNSLGLIQTIQYTIEVFLSVNKRNRLSAALYRLLARSQVCLDQTQNTHLHGDIIASLYECNDTGTLKWKHLVFGSCWLTLSSYYIMFSGSRLMFSQFYSQSSKICNNSVAMSCF